MPTQAIATGNDAFYKDLNRLAQTVHEIRSYTIAGRHASAMRQRLSNLMMYSWI
jgi:hypothetical protein